MIDEHLMGKEAAWRYIVRVCSECAMELLEGCVWVRWLVEWMDVRCERECGVM